MEVIARAIRIYGSENYYHQPRWSPDGQPLTAWGFGAPDDDAKVYFGAVPGEIQRDVSDWNTLANAMLNASVGRGSGKSGTALLEEDREELVIDEFPFYVTFVLDRRLDLPDAGGTGTEVWYDPKLLNPYDARMREDAPQAFDVLAAQLAPVLGSRYFEQKILPRQGERYVFKSSAHRMPLFFPRASMSARLSVGQAMDSFPADELHRRVAELSGRSRSEFVWLGRAMRWYAFALTTDDRWRRFQAFCFTLELLSHKLAERHRDAVLARLGSGYDGHTLDADLVDRLIADSKRMSLTAKFTVMALALDPGTAAEDVARFARIKAARDALSHGQLLEGDDLPLQEAEDLAGRYLHLVGVGSR